MFKHISNDLSSGLVVFLVAVPLCLGIALASGAPLFSGIIAGIVGGIIVGTISGSKIGVSGPAAGLAVIVYDSIRLFGTDSQGNFDINLGFPLFLGALVLSGIFQLLLSLLRAGTIAYYFPNSVIKGMLSAIGIIIILKQIPHALGHDVIAEGFDGFYQTDGENTFSELLVAISDINPLAVLITCISIFILIIWEKPFFKNRKVFNIIQGPLIVVLTGIIIGKILTQYAGFNLDHDEMVSIPLASESGGFLKLFILPDFSQSFTQTSIKVAFTMAIVASLETLLCVEATDKLDPDKNQTPVNRELIAQGFGNIFSGLLGGLPITQVVVRSSANLQSGGKTKISTIFHGVLIFISVFALPELLNLIPLSSLAAILLLVGYKLAKPVMFREMFKKGWQQYVPFFATIISIVLSDLLIGISIGLAIGLAMILFKNYATPFTIKEPKNRENLTIRLSENVTFLNKASIQSALNLIPENSEITIDASKSVYIHPDIKELIDDYIIHASTIGVNVAVIGDFFDRNENSLKLLEKSIYKDDVSKTNYLSSIWNT